MENSLVYHTSHFSGMSSPWQVCHACFCKLHRAVRGRSALCITWCLWCVAEQEQNANWIFYCPICCTLFYYTNTHLNVLFIKWLIASQILDNPSSPPIRPPQMCWHGSWTMTSEWRAEVSWDFDIYWSPQRRQTMVLFYKAHSWSLYEYNWAFLDRS